MPRWTTNRMSIFCSSQRITTALSFPLARQKYGIICQSSFRDVWIGSWHNICLLYVLVNLTLTSYLLKFKCHNDKSENCNERYSFISLHLACEQKNPISSISLNHFPNSVFFALQIGLYKSCFLRQGKQAKKAVIAHVGENDRPDGIDDTKVAARDTHHVLLNLTANIWACISMLFISIWTLE